jgi:signal transduction histidine kinase
LTDDGFADSREDAQRIRGAGTHLLELINNLLDLSKIEAGKMPLNLAEVDLVPLVEELGKDLAPLVRANGNSWTVRPDGEIGTVCLDATKLKQVLTNLISNAGKFTRNGGITVSMRNLAGTDVPRFEISVTDTGIGMSEVQIQRLFQPYQQAAGSTARKYGGTGLGLAISRQFCRLMGGDLTAKSEAGKGSTFTVMLPIRITETPESDVESSPA